MGVSEEFLEVADEAFGLRAFAELAAARDGP